MDEITKEKFKSRGLMTNCPKIVTDNNKVVYQHKYFPFKVSKIETFTNEGLGLFALLPTDELIDFIFTYLKIPDILRLASTSKEFNYICSIDKYWKLFARKKYKGNIPFMNTWKESYITYRNKQVCEKKGITYTYRGRSNDEIMRQIQEPPYWEGDLQDLLIKSFYRWYRAHVNPEWFELTCPETIERRSNLSVEEFIEKYEKPGIPVIIQGLSDDWIASKEWTKENLLRRYGDVKFRTGSGFKLTLSNYFKYLETQCDTRPLYLFDQNYPTNAKPMGEEYSIPEHFKEDLFKYTGEERPPWRWILFGPAGSGAPFHIDPRGTSAWNTVLYGKKRWALYPPEIQPPGVGPHDDDYYTAPSSLRWLLEVYPNIKNHHIKPLECIQRPGETLFIPSGWWHQVYNTEDTMAITHNFASTSNFDKVCRELTKNRDEFSDIFYEEIKKRRKDLYQIWKEIQLEYDENMSESFEESSSSDSSSSDSSDIE